MSIILSGASGFLGSSILTCFNHNELTIVGRTRPDDYVGNFIYCDFSTYSVNKMELTYANALIHCAARVHVMNDESTNPLEDYREVNTAGTLNLARQAAEAGVKRFIFISSIKVNGESTKLGQPFKASDIRNPQDFYGQSKSEAEEQLLELAEKTEMEVVIIRPPLVYGPGVKANFSSLLNLVSKGLPLPFGCITSNQRSLVSVNNLVDLIITCIDHPKAANQVFLVSDDNDLSTAGMIKEMSNALGCSNRMLPVPLSLYHFVGKVFGKQDVINRLLGSLQVDISYTKETLNWKPPQSLEDGFRETAEAFVNNKKISKQ